MLVGLLLLLLLPLPVLPLPVLPHTMQFTEMHVHPSVIFTCSKWYGQSLSCRGSRRV